jgi:SsrA-binding protein
VADNKKGTIKLISKNRKARFNYSVEDTFETGIVLLGSEVKSLRDGRLSLTDAYAKFEGTELWMMKAHISQYPFATHTTHEPERPRKLLMHKGELRKLMGKVKESGFTLIPLSFYFKEGRVKVELGLCRGKRQYDKRQDLRKKDHARDMERARKS